MIRQLQAITPMESTINKTRPGKTLKSHDDVLNYQLYIIYLL